MMVMSNCPPRGGKNFFGPLACFTEILLFLESFKVLAVQR
jgi:hypothetical protein